MEHWLPTGTVRRGMIVTGTRRWRDTKADAVYMDWYIKRECSCYLGAYEAMLVGLSQRVEEPNLPQQS